MTIPTTPVEEFLFDQLDDWGYCQSVRGLLKRAHGRGDKVLVYRNQEFGHPEMGLTKIITWGSNDAGLEARHFPEVPTTLPDMGAAINWRYQLECELT